MNKLLKIFKINRQKMILLLLFVIVSIFAVNLFRAWLRGYQISHEISTLEQEISSLQNDNRKLAELINYFNSNAYIEEKARVDLGLKKAGEKVLLVSPEANKNLLGDGQNDQVALARPNPYKWWLYFFK